MNRNTIRFKLTLWLAIMTVLAVSLTFFTVRFASNAVLHGTVRNYLIGMVEENTNKIAYVEAIDQDNSAHNIYIPHGDGYLEVDEDFLDVVNDVYAALYTADGVLIYGENPLEKEDETIEFTETHIWHKEVDGEKYDFYDRAITIEAPDDEGLWIRGVVSDAKSQEQLRDISRISFFLLPVLLAIIILCGYFLIGRYLTPLKDIESTAERISEGNDLKERLGQDLVDRKDEIGKLAYIFNNMLDRLDKSFDAEKQFTSDASHELRTPTSVIMAQSEYILEKEREPEEYRDALQVINKQSHRMDDLIGDMLDYTRLEQKSKRYEFEKLDLSRLVIEVADQMSLLGEKNIDILTDVEPWVKISGNNMLLTRMLQNLIGNAYRYGVQDGNIKVGLKKEDEKAVLTIEDNGIGIAKDEQEKIFDRFYRSDASRTIQGTGLGLAMVKKVAELHNGIIELESEENQGSLFKISFPLYE